MTRLQALLPDIHYVITANLNYIDNYYVNTVSSVAGVISFSFGSYPAGCWYCMSSRAFSFGTADKEEDDGVGLRGACCTCDGSVIRKSISFYILDTDGSWMPGLVVVRRIDLWFLGR